MRTLNNINQIVGQFFKDIPGIVAVFLFGSMVRKSESEVGDIDVAVLYHRESVPDYFERIRQREDLAATLRKEVDLVVLNTASPILKMQVLRKGQPVLINDGKQLNIFKVRALNEYVDLKTIRRPIEQNLYNTRIFHD